MTVLSGCLRCTGRARQSSLRPTLSLLAGRAATSTSCSRLHHTGRSALTVANLSRSSSLNMFVTPGSQRPHTRAPAFSSHRHSAGEGVQMHPLLQSFIGEVLAKYWDRTPTAVTILGLLQSMLGGSSPIYFDHLAFRTFAVPTLGIDSIGSIFTDFGYTKMDMLSFPGKKLTAYWYAPPVGQTHLPRVFISELRVDELSEDAQQVVHKYTGSQSRGQAGRYASLCAASGILPWDPPTAQDHATLLEESEYAAWTLVNGYNLNHAAVSVHRLTGLERGIEGLNDELLTRGFAMNEEGGILKVSPDVGLVQSSTVADQIAFKFERGQEGMVAGSYLEFAQRAVLPQFKHLPEEEITEQHRRDGFEVGNADKIFESTSAARSQKPSQPMAAYGRDYQKDSETKEFQKSAAAAQV